jgi:carbon-monoxide dehydrogenase medium subunit/xanthine dehydrogenase FAD-binding subunit
MLLCDQYITPSTLGEAFATLEAHEGRCRIVAGATDLLPWAREGRAGDVHVPVLIDVTRIPELLERECEGGRVRLGAATPMQRFLDEPGLARALPCMPRCAVWFADDQIRASATIGGNIVNASPAADGTPGLLVHDAQVELAARRGGALVRRRLPLADFVTGRGQTRLAPGELLLAIECEALPGYGGSFEKVGHRRSLVISLVCLAALVKVDPAGRRIEDARLAIAGIGPVPQRLDEVETLLRGAPVDAQCLLQAAELPVELVQSRSRQTYRREVVRGFVARALVNALARAGADPALLPADAEAAHA